MALPRRQILDERHARDEQRQRKVAALHDRALAQIRELRTGDDWAGCLRLAARFPGQSFTNIMLIAAQRPGATLVAGYREWQARGPSASHGVARSPCSDASHSPPGAAA